nr:integrase, catalytic region, zinc finger, CCHC-type, peptidase aspartic, catalytic [Tanacetum cinerariifolium]
MANFSEDIQCAGSEHHEVHEMHDDVQPNCVVVSDTEYTGDSNMIQYDQYVKDNAEPVVRNNASSVSNDASMIIINEMPELTPRCDSVKEHTKVVDASLTAELAIYKKQFELITPTGLTEGEMGFEQTKECYLTEIIPFFKTIKEHFEGIQMALTKDIKEMKEFFDELEAEVDQNAVNKKWDRSRLMNFVKKFIGTVKFKNDHFGAIMGYGDYVIGESVLSRVYYVEELGTISSRENLGKLQPTADVGIFVGYAPSRKGYRIYNKRRRRIMETNHVQFDELSEPMDPMQLSTRPAPTFMTSVHISSGLALQRQDGIC